MELTEHQKRLKRLRIRCWRRGTKEMDLLFGQFADSELASMSPASTLALGLPAPPNDQDLYLWISGATVVPEGFMPAVQMVRRFHKIT